MSGLCDRSTIVLLVNKNGGMESQLAHAFNVYINYYNYAKFIFYTLFFFPTKGFESSLLFQTTREVLVTVFYGTLGVYKCMKYPCTFDAKFIHHSISVSWPYISLA